jgi:hypothetical protein
MPFLLMDDAADQARQRLGDFAGQQLQAARSAAAQDITQRLQQYGQAHLDALQAQVPQVDPATITQRLLDYGQSHLDALQQAPQDLQQNAISGVADQAQQRLEAAIDAARRGDMGPFDDYLADRQQQVAQSLPSSWTATGPAQASGSLSTTGDVGRDVGGFVAPTSRFIQGAVAELERQRQQRIAAMSPLDRLDAAIHAARQGTTDVGELSRMMLGVVGDELPGAALAGKLLEANPMTSSAADLSPLVSTGLRRAGMEDTPAGALGLASNLLLPTGEAASAERGFAAAAPRVAQDVAQDVAPLAERAAQDAPVVVDAVRKFLTGEGSELGSIAPQAGARIGGAVAGGVIGNQLTPEDADPLARAAHIGAGALAGMALPNAAAAIRDARPTQAELDALRAAARPSPTAEGATEAFVRQNVLRQTPSGLPSGTVAQDLTSFGKSNLLSSPWTQLTNIATQAVELAQQPLGAAASGREAEAVAGLNAIKDVIPEALGRFKDTLASGVSFYADPSRPITRTYSPFFRLLSASDDAFRTMGEAMGRAQEAQRVLRENGSPTSAAQITSLIQANANRILTAGDRMSNLSVFGEGPTTGLGRQFSNLKQNLLSSPNKGSQAMGGLLDALVPFSGIPDRIWALTVLRAPGVNEANTLRKLGMAGLRRDPAAAQDALAGGLVNSVVNMAILSQVAHGNITGPDDPEHPNGINVGGHWLDYSSWGPLAGQFAIPAAIAESARKTANTPGAGVGDYLNGFANASGKTVLQLGYLDNLINLVSRVGQGNLTGAATSTATQYLDRLVPASGLLNTVEQLLDQNLRDVSPGRPWEREMSRIPGLADLLPTKVNPMTGEALQRSKVGQAFLPRDPLTTEIDRLNRAGYSLSVPKDYPTSVSASGYTARLSPAEGRQVTQITGNFLGGLADRLNSPGYREADDDRKARIIQAYLDAADKDRIAAARDVLGPEELRQRLIQGERVVGRYVNQSMLPLAQAIETPPVDPNTNQSAALLTFIARLQDAIAQARQSGDQERASQLEQQLNQVQRQG